MSRAVLLVVENMTLPALLVTRWLKQYLALPYDLYYVTGLTNFPGAAMRHFAGRLVARRWPRLSIQFEKLQAISLLTCYDQVLVLDLDLLITDRLDDIFTHTHGLLARVEPDPHLLDEAFPEWPVAPANWQCFNSGVVLWNRAGLPDPAGLLATLECMLPAALAHKISWLNDQALLNLAAAKRLFPIMPLPDEYNRFPHEGERPAKVWHFISPCIKPWEDRRRGIYHDWYETRPDAAPPADHPAYHVWDTEFERLQKDLCSMV